VLRIRIRVRIILGLDPDPHQRGKLDLNTDSHQSEKVEAVEGHFGALEGPNLEKSEWQDLDPAPHKIER
jgi:hypothetical protein